MKKKIIKIKGLELHKRQEQIKDDIINSNKKFYIINSSRQAGKTCLLEQLSLYFSISDKGTNTLWVSPSYSITKKSFINIIDNIIESGIIRSYSKAEQSIELINNSRIFFKSGNNFDMIRGGSYDYCFIDEMSYIEEEAFTKAIRPTLSVKGKKCIIASTPKGKNYFHNLSMLGQNPDEENYS